MPWGTCNTLAEFCHHAPIQALAADDPESLQLPAHGVIPCAQVIKACDLGLEGSQFLPLYPDCAVSTDIVRNFFYRCIHMDYSLFFYGMTVLPE